MMELSSLHQDAPDVNGGQPQAGIRHKGAAGVVSRDVGDCVGADVGTGVLDVGGCVGAVVGLVVPASQTSPS
jgi:hypothetical protein